MYEEPRQDYFNIVISQIINTGGVLMALFHKGLHEINKYAMTV